LSPAYHVVLVAKLNNLTPDCASREPTRTKAAYFPNCLGNRIAHGLRAWRTCQTSGETQTECRRCGLRRSDSNSTKDDNGNDSPICVIKHDGIVPSKTIEVLLLIQIEWVLALNQKIEPEFVDGVSV